MPIIRFYVIRHSSVADSSKIYGASDVPIRDFQISDKDALVKLIPHVDIAISSPLSRATVTMDRILAALGISALMVTDARISEQNFGDLELTNPEAIENSNSRSYWHLSHDQRPQNGESFEDVFTRVSDFLNEQIKGEEDKDILLCTHGGVIKAMLGYILKIPLENCCVIDIAPLSLSIFEYKSNIHGSMLWYFKSLGIKLI